MMMPFPSISIVNPLCWPAVPFPIHMILVTPPRSIEPGITWPQQHPLPVFGTTQVHGRSWETGAEQTESNFILVWEKNWKMWMKQRHLNADTKKAKHERSCQKASKSFQRPTTSSVALKGWLEASAASSLHNLGKSQVAEVATKWLPLMLSAHLQGPQPQPRSQVTATPKWPFQSLTAPRIEAKARMIARGCKR